MKFVLKCFSTSFVFISVSFPQSQHTIMTYNLLNYTLSDTAAKNPYLRTILSNIQPDILIVEEIDLNFSACATGLLNNVLNKISSGYAAGTTVNGPDLDNAIFYKTSLFTFLSNTPISTSLRNINEFKLRHNLSGDTLRIYAVHLKASDTSSDSLQRAAEVDSLRKRTDALPSNSNYIVLGDFNIYDSGELAFQKLLNQTNPGYFIDPLNLVGHWNNNSSFRFCHTQSTRTIDLGDGGATGGLDDRFDMILMSQSVMNSGGITYVQGSYTPYGNDGNHFNDSINQPPNSSVTQQIADALYYSSDHLPVYAGFSFDSPYVELTSFTALIEGFYNGTTMIPDTVTIELHNSDSPYTLVDQAKVFLNSSGNGTAKFYNASNGIPYYLVLKHRNSIETWSAASHSFLNGVLTYDFTSSSNMAFGNNLKLVGSKWCIYSGDVNQDGFINSQDLNLVFSDNINGTKGYISSDLNGDMFAEIKDVTIVFINNVLGIGKIIP